MVCENCGKQNPENAVFCEACGATMTVTTQETPGKKRTGLFIGIISLAFVAIVVAALFIFGAFKPGSVKAAEKYWSAYLKSNAKTAFNLYSPYFKDYAEENDMEDDVKDSIEEEMEEFKEDGKKCSVTSFELTKKYSQKEVKKIEKYLEETKYDCDPDGYKIQEIHVVEFKKIQKEDDDKREWDDNALMIKIKGKWYMEIEIDKNDVPYILENVD
ncbi:MAG: zinc-ribbon domain-containing protein [Clostridia bacterium]|nr:zinc-ribbon domain-containing protein [Clostridia bacterium]